MSTFTTFLFVFVFILIIGAWITSEVISNKTSKTNKKYSKQLALMERENNKLQTALTNETNRYARLKEEYDLIKTAKAEIRELNAQIKVLTKQYGRVQEGVMLLRKKTTSKKYSSNSLAKEVIVVLDEYAPTDAQKELNKEMDTHVAFKRIKNSMGMGEE